MMHEHTHIYTQLCGGVPNAHIHMCMYVFMYLCISIYIIDLYMYIYYVYMKHRGTVVAVQSELMFIFTCGLHVNVNIIKVT